MTLVVKPISALLTHDTEMFSNMDPYVIVQIANQRQRSKTHKQGGKKPHWSDILRFKQVNSTKMVITVMDEDTITDDTIGTGAYDFSKQMNSGTQSKEYINLTYKGRPAGKVYISICYEKPGNLENNNNQNPYGNTNTNNNNINPYGYTNNNTFNNPPPPPSNNYNNFGSFNPPQQIGQQFAMNMNNQPQQPNIGSGKQLFDIIGTSINSSNNLPQQNSGWSNNNSNQNSGWGNQQQPPNNGWGKQPNNGWSNQPQSNWGSNNNGWGNPRGSKDWNNNNSGW